MVLDDNLDFLSFTKDLLKAAGYEVRVSNKPAEGWNEFKRLKPDCLILDLSMPFLNGREFFPWARKESPETIIIICTGTDLKDEPFFLQNGIKHILHKPITSATLVRTIENAVYETKRCLP